MQRHTRCYIPTGFPTFVLVVFATNIASLRDRNDISKSLCYQYFISTNITSLRDFATVVSTLRDLPLIPHSSQFFVFKDRDQASFHINQTLFFEV